MDQENNKRADVHINTLYAYIHTHRHTDIISHIYYKSYTSTHINKYTYLHAPPTPETD